MRAFRTTQIYVWVFILSIARANAVQINLSGDYIERYYRILENYILPLMVVSTVVLFCGYLASRIYHRVAARREPAADDDDAGLPPFASAEDGTAAFLRELKATPPIEEPVETKRDPQIRAPHPLLRKRAANAAAALRSKVAAEEAAPTAPARPAAPPRPAAPSRSGRGTGMDLRATPAREEAEPPRRTARPLSPPPETPPAPAAPDMREMRDMREPRDDVGQRPAAAHGEQETARAKVDPPPVATTSIWWQEPGAAPRIEPSTSVVQALKKSAPPSPDLEAARARAVEIVDTLDKFTGVLQRGNTLIAERIKAKQGLDRADVEGLRIVGFDMAPGIEEELRKLGGDVAAEVLTVYAAVAKFNNVLRRLEQMTASEPLDEGWNDLLRARMSEMLFVVGQLRKTLGSYRRPSARPANGADKPDRPGGSSDRGPDRPVPLGRRQV
jgi:hypothetical protein